MDVNDVIWYRASEVAAVLGIHGFESPVKTFKRLWKDMDGVAYCVATSEAKKSNPVAGCIDHRDVLRRNFQCPGKVCTELVEKAKMSERNCHAGRVCESSDIDTFEAQTWTRVGQRNSKMLRYLHGDGTWGIRGRVDGRTENGGILESKRRTSRHVFDRPSIPSYDRIQCMVYMKLADSEHASLVEHFGYGSSQECRHRRILWNATEWQEVIVPGLVRFACAVRQFCSRTDNDKAAWLAKDEADQLVELQELLNSVEEEPKEPKELKEEPKEPKELKEEPKKAIVPHPHALRKSCPIQNIL